MSLKYTIPLGEQEICSWSIYMLCSSVAMLNEVIHIIMPQGIGLPLEGNYCNRAILAIKNNGECSMTLQSISLLKSTEIERVRV